MEKGYLPERAGGVEGMVSVVIPTFQRPDRVRRAVEAALAQNVDKLEVIVVDDNREEFARVQTLESLREVNDTRLIYVTNQRRAGGCGARNFGINCATGEFIAFLDDDDEYLPCALRAHLDALAEHTDSALSFGHAEVVDEVYGYSWTYAPQAATYGTADLLSGNCPISSSVVMARRAALIEAGMFDEEMPSFQDLDMWLRIAQEGHVVAHCTKVARFVQHNGVRTSVDIGRRVAGLERLIEKWRVHIEADLSVRRFRDRFLSAMYLQNAKVLLGGGLRYRRAALACMWLALVHAKSRRVRVVGHIGLAILGFHVSRTCVRTAARWRAWRRGMG